MIDPETGTPYDPTGLDGPIEGISGTMELTREIVRVLAPVHPERIILFGSRARGDADAMSDVDLIVVYRTDKRFLDRLDELYSIWDLPVPVDMLAYTPEEFTAMLAHSAFVVDAVREGRDLLEPTGPRS